MTQFHPVVFVGAGPGDPELVTVKGQRALAEADLILYAGSLVHESVLSWASVEAEAMNTASMNLDEILETMVQAVRQGKKVVRLHTGDLSLFSAVGEQTRELDKARIPYEMVPGVTAAFAAASALGKEYTIPEVTQTVILTRAAGRTPVPDSESIRALAGHRATMAIYLSLKQLDSVLSDLSEGYGEDAPIVVAYRVSWPDEIILKGTLRDIGSKVRAAGIDRHALIIVGPALDDDGRTRSKLYDATFSHSHRKGSAR